MRQTDPQLVEKIKALRHLGYEGELTYKRKVTI